MTYYFAKNLKFLRKNKGVSQSQLSDLVSKGNTTIANWEKEVSEPNILEILYISKYFEVSVDDLLNNDLSNTHLLENINSKNIDTNAHLNTHPSTHLKSQKYTEANIVNEPEEVYGKSNPVHNSIPLVSLKAVAGFGNGTVCLEKSDIKEHYVIPKFKNKKIDFLIEMEGDSMATTYSNGDVLACTIISEQSFIQWNRVYVVCTKDQGLIVKRVRQSEKEGCYLMVSDNSDYAPFNVPISLIDSIALVQGGVWSE